MIDVSGLIAINPHIDWQFLNRIPVICDQIAYVDSLTIQERRTEAMKIIEAPIKRQNLTNGYVETTQRKLNILIAALPEDMRNTINKKLSEKYRWAPLINDTKNLNFTGTDKHLG